MRLLAASSMLVTSILAGCGGGGTAGPSAAVVTGVLFDDVERDNSQGAGDQVLANIPVYLWDGLADQLIGQTITNADGVFALSSGENVPALVAGQPYRLGISPTESSLVTAVLGSPQPPASFVAIVLPHVGSDANDSDSAVETIAGEKFHVVQFIAPGPGQLIDDIGLGVFGITLEN